MFTYSNLWYLPGGASIFGDWWSGCFFVGDLVICTWKNWWFGDLQKLWWWWFTYFLLGDLVIRSWKKWWFGDFEKLWWWWLSYFCRWFGDYSRSEVRAKKVPKIAIFNRNFRLGAKKCVVIWSFLLGDWWSEGTFGDGDFRHFLLVIWWFSPFFVGDLVIKGGDWPPPIVVTIKHYKNNFNFEYGTPQIHFSHLKCPRVTYI